MNSLDGANLWGIALLVVGVPLTLIVLTELIGWLDRRQHPAAAPLRLLRNWVIPVASLFALLAFAFESSEDQVWVRFVATVLGFLLILLVLSAFNVALFSNAQSGSWRERIPSIFVEIARLALVLFGVAMLFSWVWNADVGGLIAALGVTSIIIGLALQNAVGGVISGLLLLFEQPFRIGDWLSVAGVWLCGRGQLACRAPRHWLGDSDHPELEPFGSIVREPQRSCRAALCDDRCDVLNR